VPPWNVYSTLDTGAAGLGAEDAGGVVTARDTDTRGVAEARDVAASGLDDALSVTVARGTGGTCKAVCLLCGDSHVAVIAVIPIMATRPATGAATRVDHALWCLVESVPVAGRLTDSGPVPFSPGGWRRSTKVTTPKGKGGAAAPSSAGRHSRSSWAGSPAVEAASAPGDTEDDGG
jgi:hypothetical protein